MDFVFGGVAAFVVCPFERLRNLYNQSISQSNKKKKKRRLPGVDSTGAVIDTIDKALKGIVGTPPPLLLFISNLPKLPFVLILEVVVEDDEDDDDEEDANFVL